MSVWSGLTVSRDSHDDDIRVDFRQLIRPDAPAFQGAWTEVFNNDVGIFGQGQDGLSASLVTQVQLNGLLIATQGAENHGSLPPQCAPVPDLISRYRFFNFDNFRSKVSKNSSGKWSSNEIAQLQHADSF